QEAARKMRFSSQQTMRTAQRLYENGYITYMRTDSVNLSESAIAAARTQIRDLYGDAAVPPQPRRYTSKVKNAQEAHEAIRPSSGSGAEDALLVAADHAHGAAALRERLHHLYAYRLGEPLRVGHRRRPHPDPRPLRRRRRAAAAAPLHLEGEERAGGPRGHPP